MTCVKHDVGAVRSARISHIRAESAVVDRLQAEGASAEPATTPVFRLGVESLDGQASAVVPDLEARLDPREEPIPSDIAA